MLLRQPTFRRYLSDSAGPSAKDAMMKRANINSRLYLLIAGMVMLGTAAPSFAQLADEDIVVTGRYGPIPDSAQSLSQSVSYADLDLSTIADRQVLRHRLSLTSRY